MARAINKIEANLPQEKINFITDAHQKELQYWKSIALESKNEHETKQLTDLAPLRVFLAREAVVKNDAKKVNNIHLTTRSQELLLKTFIVKKTNLSKKLSGNQ